MKKYLENNLASFRIEKGILHVTYRENTIIFLRGAMEVVTQRLILQQGKAYPILCNIKGVRDIAGDACRYLAEEGTVLVKALALVHVLPLSKLFTRLYINDFPPIPIKTFTDEARALDFLAQWTDRDLIDF